MARIRIVIVFVFLLTAFTAVVSPAQKDREKGAILSISDNTVVVHFEYNLPNLGDVVVFMRVKEIIDPVTGRVMGSPESEIASGVVEDMGLGKVYVNIVTKTSAPNMSDIAYFTGRVKTIVRTKKVVGRIQQLVSEKEIEIDVGTDEEINEGDFFLVNRTENVYDSETNEVTETTQIEIGRGRVSKVADNTSMAEIIELNEGVELNLETDNIVFEPTAPEDMPAPGAVDATESAILHDEIDSLRNEVAMLRATVDSLGLDHHLHRNEFQTLKDEMERVFSSLMKSDLAGMKISLKNDEPLTPIPSGDEWAMYKSALDICLAHDFVPALKGFAAVIERYPNSKLTENSRYWIAQSNFNLRDYDTAITWFRAVIDDTRFSHKDDDASIMLGITYYRLGKSSEALTEFQRFSQAYPESEYAGKVRNWIEKLS